MKKVVLLGDSIRIGYGKKVPEMLKGEYEVWQPEDNCRYSAYTYRMFYEYINELSKADVIHWNNGLWDATHCVDGDAFMPLDYYLYFMKRIAQRLLKITDKVIFATTTAASDENPYDKNDTIKKYNEAVVPMLREMGVTINDLHSIVYPKRAQYVCEDKLHLTDEGYEVCAKQVCEAIRSIDK